MSRYFTLISHHDPKKRKSFYEKTQRANLTLSIGWGDVNPIGSTRTRIRRNLEASYSDFATLNITNGEHSLELFSKLTPGDVVFVRGNSSITDIAIVTGIPFYQYGAGHYGLGDYCTKVSFAPLLDDQRFELAVRDIPEKFHKEFVFNDGRSRTMKQINKELAITLMKLIFETI